MWTVQLYKKAQTQNHAYRSENCQFTHPIPRACYVNSSPDKSPYFKICMISFTSPDFYCDGNSLDFSWRVLSSQWSTQFVLQFFPKLECTANCSNSFYFLSHIRKWNWNMWSRSRGVWWVETITPQSMNSYQWLTQVKTVNARSSTYINFYQVF